MPFAPQLLGREHVQGLASHLVLFPTIQDVSRHLGELEFGSLCPIALFGSCLADSLRAAGQLLYTLLLDDRPPPTRMPHLARLPRAESRKRQRRAHEAPPVQASAGAQRAPESS